ncbi:P27 family phage terminase small subunit [Candidatus Pacearchaeota archaeon]|jgi:P27 family predicted phage terminase small subunit|nr:P27 family phage terminase small subunit [Candidatus Pacearchaeota archaeon]
MGGKGSGGYNRKSIEQHIRDGTYRVDRHGPVTKRLAAKITSDVERFRREMEAGEVQLQASRQTVPSGGGQASKKDNSLSAKQKGLAAKPHIKGAQGEAPADRSGGSQAKVQNGAEASGDHIEGRGKGGESKQLQAGGDQGKGEQLGKAQVETPIVCPEWLDVYARDEFVRVCQVLHDMGTLQDVNHATLEGYCAAYSRAVRAEIELKDGFEEAVTFYSKTGDPYDVMKKKTEVSVAEKAWMQVKTFAVELGITSSRGQKETEENMSELERVLQQAEHKPR